MTCCYREIITLAETCNSLALMSIHILSAVDREKKKKKQFFCHHLHVEQKVVIESLFEHLNERAENVLCFIALSLLLFFSYDQHTKDLSHHSRAANVMTVIHLYTRVETSGNRCWIPLDLCAFVHEFMRKHEHEPSKPHMLSKSDRVKYIIITEKKK